MSSVSDAIEYLARHKETFDCITAIDIIEHLAKSELPLLFWISLPGIAPPRSGEWSSRRRTGQAPAASSVRYGDFSHEQCLTPDLLGVLDAAVWPCRLWNERDRADVSGCDLRVRVAPGSSFAQH